MELDQNLWSTWQWEWRRGKPTLLTSADRSPLDSFTANTNKKNEPTGLAKSITDLNYAGGQTADAKPSWYSTHHVYSHVDYTSARVMAERQTENIHLGPSVTKSFPRPEPCQVSLMISVTNDKETVERKNLT